MPRRNVPSHVSSAVVFPKLRDAPSRFVRSRRRGDPSPSPLLLCASLQDWGGVVAFCDAHPLDVAACVNEWGDTALHLACRHRAAPLAVVERLVAAGCSPSARDDFEGATALHHAAARGCSRAVVEALSSAVGVRDRGGRTPLFHALGGHVGPPDRAALALLVTRGAVSQRDGRGRGPLRALRDRHARRTRDFLRYFGTSTRCFRDANPGFLRSALETWLGEFWDRAVTVICGSCYGDGDDDGDGDDGDAGAPLTRRRVLHACVELGESSCPSEIVEVAMVARPEEVRERDNHGNWPLHLAVARPPPTTTEATDTERDDDGGFNVVTTLVRLFPEAASFRNDRGELPLELALRVGKWRWGPEVRAILAAHTDAFECLNVSDWSFCSVLGLLSGTTEEDDNRDNGSIDEHEGDTDSITVVYRLLGQRPSIMSRRS